MNQYIHIDFPHPGYYYSFFYVLAFLCGFVWLMIEGRRRKFPVLSWLLLVASSFLFFMIGCRWIAFGRAEWSYIMRLEAIPYSTARSVLGGILFSIPGILLAKKALKFKNNVIDAFSIVVPAGMLIQRFGCLLAGCCYGTITDVPWAVRYGPQSPVFADQLRHGVIDAYAICSRPVHPVQLYEIASSLVIVILVVRFRRSLRAPGNPMALFLMLYSFARFFLEFARSSEGRVVGKIEWLGLNAVQYSMLLIVPALVMFIRRRERQVSTVQNEPADQEFNRPSLYFIFLGVMFVVVSRWMSPLEIIAFNIVLVPLLLSAAYHIFTHVTLPHYRLASLVLPAAALMLLTNQTLPEPVRSDSTKIRFNTITIGALDGSTAGQILVGQIQNTNCNGQPTGGFTPIYDSYNNDFTVYGAGFQHTNQSGRANMITYGFNVFAGGHTASDPATDRKYSIAGISPYMQIDRKDVGIGFGFTAGDFTQIGVAGDDSGAPVTRKSIYPSFNIRLGQLRGTFMEYRFAQQFPTAFPALTHQLNFGVAVGGKRKSVIRIGTSSNFGFVTGGTFNMGPNVMGEVNLGALGGIGTKYENSNNFLFSTSIRLKVGRKILRE